MRFFFFSFLLSMSFGVDGYAQGGFVFGFKGGLTLGLQNWNGLEQDPLFKYHGIAFIESLDEANDAFAIFVQAGYHLKGSAIRNRNFFNPISGNVYRPPAREFLFHNLSLTFGGKRKYPYGDAKVYYLLGIRGEYTITTNLDAYQAFNEANPAYSIYPWPFFVNRFNYGVTVGGGVELSFGELMGGLLEFSVNPDFSYQYRQPAIPNVQNPYTGQTTTIPERLIRNISFELSLGLRFLRKVIYVD